MVGTDMFMGTNNYSKVGFATKLTTVVLETLIRHYGH